MVAAFQVSQRRACAVLGSARSSVRYRSVRPKQEALRRRIRDLAQVRVRYGYRRIHVLLRREGWPVNHKRVYRLYSEEGLVLKRRRPKRHRSATTRVERPAASVPNERWSMDFMSDTLADGRRLKVLTMLDTCTRECLALEAAGTFRGRDVAAVLTRLAVERGLPDRITCDNGTEFTSKVLDHWAYRSRVRLDFTRPGKPTDNAHIESFNARVRQECLSQHWFIDLADARRTLASWKEDYNNHRPHSALADLTPIEYRRAMSYELDRRESRISRA